MVFIADSRIHSVSYFIPRRILVHDHAAPAVILYNSVLALQAVGWIFLSHAVISNDLCRSAEATAVIKKNNRYGYFALALYTICAIVAAWSP